MLMPDTTQLALLQGYVLPALSTASSLPSVCVDHNWIRLRIRYVLSGLTTQQLTQVAGTPARVRSARRAADCAE